MVLKLYGHPNSTCTIRVLTILYEKGVPFEFVTVNMQEGEHKTAEYLEKQPFGVIPYLDDDGFIVYESRAIGYYIARKYADQGTPLVPSPTDLQAQTRLVQALVSELTNFAPAERALVENLFKPKLKKIPANPEVFASHIADLELQLDAYERILSKTKYIGGDQLTLADLFHLPFGELLKVAGSDTLESPKRPNVLRWFNEIRSRESYQKARPGLSFYGI